MPLLAGTKGPEIIIQSIDKGLGMMHHGLLEEEQEEGCDPGWSFRTLVAVGERDDRGRREEAVSTTGVG